MSPEEEDDHIARDFQETEATGYKLRVRGLEGLGKEWQL